MKTKYMALDVHGARIGVLLLLVNKRLREVVPEAGIEPARLF
jgi:hypothetical protein